MKILKETIPIKIKYKTKQNLKIMETSEDSTYFSDHPKVGMSLCQDVVSNNSKLKM